MVLCWLIHTHQKAGLLLITLPFPFKCEHKISATAQEGQEHLERFICLRLVKMCQRLCARVWFLNWRYVISAILPATGLSGPKRMLLYTFSTFKRATASISAKTWNWKGSVCKGTLISTCIIKPLSSCSRYMWRHRLPCLEKDRSIYQQGDDKHLHL